MTLQEAIKTRHSVRQYLDKPVEAEKLAQIAALIDDCNRLGYAPVDLGIAKCHFEIGAGKENFEWV